MKADTAARRRQLITLMKVYEQAEPYYRAALRPIIKTVMQRIEGA